MISDAEDTVLAGRPLIHPHSNGRQSNCRHDDNRGGHDDYGTHYWTCYDDFRMAFVGRVSAIMPMPVIMSVPSAFGDKTSGGSEEGNNTGKEQDFFHIQVITLGAEPGLLYGV
jgi:hypothetical protein